MLPVLITILQTAYAQIKEHPDIVEALIGKTLGLLVTGSAKHDDAAAQAGLAAGLAALASSAATTAMERSRRRAALAAENATLPLSDGLLEAYAPPRAEDAAALVALLNRISGAELFAVRGMIEPLSSTPSKEIQS